MQVKLTYFGERGEFLGEGGYHSAHASIPTIVNEARNRVYNKQAPGINDGKGVCFVLVDMPESPYSCPTLLVNDMERNMEKANTVITIRMTKTQRLKLGEMVHESGLSMNKFCLRALGLLEYKEESEEKAKQEVV